jgi:hypothetical protein
MTCESAAALSIKFEIFRFRTHNSMVNNGVVGRVEQVSGYKAARQPDWR